MISRFAASVFVLLCALLAAPAFAQSEDTLCPSIDTIKNNTGQDMAGVQADIDRLSLCVERARLLKQLDEVAQQRKDMLDKVNGIDAKPSTLPPALGIAGLGAVPAMPASALPTLAVPKNLKPGDVKITGAGSSPLDAAVASLVAPEWKVRKIWGQGAAMRAQLSDGKGTLINVVKGDPLPDGPIVESVSVKGVAVSQNGKIKDLSWDDVSGADAAPASSASSTVTTTTTANDPQTTP